MTIGERIKQEREKAGISQAELARRTGGSLPYLCNLEKGIKDDPSISVLVRIADGLGIKVSTLVRGI